MPAKTGWKIPLLIGVAAVLVAALFAVLGRGEAPAPAEAPERPVAAAPSPPAFVPAVPTPRASPGPSPSGALGPLLQRPVAESSEAPPTESPVNLEELRAKLPDNLYWELEAPTKDPEVLRQRAETLRKWNEVFGKVQSGDASEEEIHRYFDYRRKASEDAITLAQRMLTDYGATLPERDKGLLDLSIRMHQDRLKEVPRQTDEALARKKLQDQRREEWIRNGKKVP